MALTDLTGSSRWRRPLGYRGQILALAALAGCVPLTLLVTQTAVIGPGPALLSLLGLVLALSALAYQLRVENARLRLQFRPVPRLYVSRSAEDAAATA